jgi:hypothetical protein
MREYEEHRAHEGRMLLIEITVTGHSPDTGQIVADFGAWGKKAAPPQHHLFPRYEVDVDVLEWVGSQSEIYFTRHLLLPLHQANAISARYIGTYL